MVVMMMIAFTSTTFDSSVVPLIEILCSSNPGDFEFSGFWRNRNRIDNLGINSPSLWLTYLRSKHCLGCGYRSHASILEFRELYLHRDLMHNIRSLTPNPLFPIACDIAARVPLPQSRLAHLNQKYAANAVWPLKPLVTAHAHILSFIINFEFRNLELQRWLNCKHWHRLGTNLWTLVTLYLLPSHYTRGLQYPKQSDWRLTLSRLLVRVYTEHQ